MKLLDAFSTSFRETFFDAALYEHDDGSQRLQITIQYPSDVRKGRAPSTFVLDPEGIKGLSNLVRYNDR